MVRSGEFTAQGSDSLCATPELTYVAVNWPDGLSSKQALPVINL